MIKLCADGSPSASEAKSWALMRMTGLWSAYDIRAELKNAGVYDAKKVVVNAIETPEAPAGTYTEQDVLAKTGDAAKGAALAQRCIMCHQLNGNGPAYGPELKGRAARQSREALVRAIVNPSPTSPWATKVSPSSWKGRRPHRRTSPVQQRPDRHHLDRRRHPAGPQGPGGRRPDQDDPFPDDVRRAAGSERPGRGRHRRLPRHLQVSQTAECGFRGGFPAGKTPF
jgi:mono/diheme cytochrome c family protein